MSSFTTIIGDELLEFWTSTDPFHDVMLENVETPLIEYVSGVPESRNDKLPELTSDNSLLTTIPQFSTVHKNPESNYPSSSIPTILNEDPGGESFCVNDIDNRDFDNTREYTSLSGPEYQLLVPPLDPLHEIEDSTSKITLFFQWFCILV